ncbi:carboxymuconolactone decarboxylase family protein [Aquabacterium sp.]|uniref:carboxymuconolactone decarboxylase family protein n=1 Tax=Aquabacterium sp. TaxID=1872578 RepID=UPI0035AEECB5
MKRYRLIPYDDACADTRVVYDDFMQVTGSTSVPIWLQSLGHTPSLTKAYWERAKGTLFGGNLPLPLKEMIVFVVSAKNGARYCSACHAQNVLALDKTLSFEDLQNFLSVESGRSMPPYYQSAVAFAGKVIDNPNCLEDADFEALMDDGFSQEEICELIAVIDMTAMFNIYTSSLQLDLDPEYRAIL